MKEVNASLKNNNKKSWFRDAQSSNAFTTHPMPAGTAIPGFCELCEKLVKKCADTITAAAPSK